MTGGYTPPKLTWDLKLGFPKIRGTFMGAPIVRIIVYWDLYRGSPYFGKLPNGLFQRGHKSAI